MNTYEEVYMTPTEAELIDANNIRHIFAKFAGLLKIRADLYSYYDRSDMVLDSVSDPVTAQIFTPIARYATDVACGYFIGKPAKYYSRVTTTVRTMELINGAKRSVLEPKKPNGEDIVGGDEQMEADENDTYMSVYRAVLRRNHEDEQNLALARDALIHRTAFERIYIVKDPSDGHPDIRFTTVDPKKCVMIRDTTVERKPVAFICHERFTDPFTNELLEQYELITAQRHMFYRFRSEYSQAGNVPSGVSYQDQERAISEFPASEEDMNLIRLVGIPIIEYPMPDGRCFYEDVIPLINARDALLNNMKNTFKYNDEAILLLTGYMKPQNEEEAAQMKESIEKFKTMYLGEDNKVEWLLKNVPIESFNGYYQMLSSDIFAMLGIKNPVKTSEVYQNITTVRYQNYGMDNVTLGMERVFERSLLEGRAKAITKLLNYLNDTDWNWEVLDVAFDRNLPSSRVEEAQFISQMKAANVLSDRDILDQVQFVEDSDAAVLRKHAQDREEAEQMAEEAARAVGNTYLDRQRQEVSPKENVENDKRLDRDDERLRKSGQNNL